VRALAWYTAVTLLLLDAGLVIVAVAVHRGLRSLPSLLLMLASISYAVASSSWYAVYFIAGLVTGEHVRTASRAHTLDAWRYYIEHTFQASFVVLLIFGLVSLLRQRSADDTPTI